MHYKVKNEIINDKSLIIPSSFPGFCNFTTYKTKNKKGRSMYVFEGKYKIENKDYICPNCNSVMEINDSYTISVKHLPIGGILTKLEFPHVQFLCKKCNKTHMQDIPFKAKNHFITIQLENYIKQLLATNSVSMKFIAAITGVCKNIIKEIDLARLKDKYTKDGELIKPEHQAYYLGIDEFSLHKNHVYATHIIDLERGEILWIEQSKKKQVVYDFIEHVGIDWMNNVIAVACDMNSDFSEAFQEKCPHLKIVYDHFHIVKNFNEKVITPVRLDIVKNLQSQGKFEEARKFKGQKYLLCMSKSTREKREKEAHDGKVIKKKSEIFKTPEVKRTKECERDYNVLLLTRNELLLTLDLIKDHLKYAFNADSTEDMKKEINLIINECRSTDNKHFLWFAKLLENHYDGIVSHAEHKISTGKIEGINNKIKTLRRLGYGYPNDEYFFLKLFDLSRKNHNKNHDSFDLAC